ncbi:hypothetical protein [Nodularia sp. NIES-3585]|uniref:hypothetical protein n=1 Tax=Nodularia sp. NIES-3585 TaxID=1973477 RepID=UPI000B6EB6C5|nr:hypothetical protein [Nodularia sp. NIES-3585]GAX36242.1 hypothetical protein NIES3585_22680 [Nodularia sp. NIES-3585]
MGNVILLDTHPRFDEVVIVTTNLKHISRFESEGICVADWQQTLNNFDSDR